MIATARERASARGASPVLDRLERAWARTDSLFALLTPAALYERPIDLRQPFIFYLGHLPAFAWNQVCRSVLDRPSFDQAFDELFARGIDPVEGDGFRPAPADVGPAAARVRDYRDRVRDAVRAATAELGDHLILSVALEPELRHQETLLYMFQQLPAHLKVPPASRPRPESLGSPPAGRTIRIPAGLVRLGAERGEIPFGWDNEFGREDVEVEAFTLDATPVRNRELREFVADGGYARRELWREEDWAWRESAGLVHPHMWRRSGGDWFQQTLFGEVPLDDAADWPACTSWAESHAFSRWRGARLPTEAEWVHAAYGSPDGTERAHPWDGDPPSERHGNFGLRHWSPLPVGLFPGGASAFGALDLVGNGWEWTGSVFAPFPGFTPYIRSYPGYSADFFDGRHYVLRGASWATDDALVRRTFRNWFQPHYPYVFAKFRCVSS